MNFTMPVTSRKKPDRPATVRTSDALAAVADAPAVRPKKQAVRLEQILDAAEQVVAQWGPTASTMDQVAKAAGLSRPLVYVYFQDMQAIMRAVALRALQQLDGRFAAAAGSEKLGLRQVLAIGQAYIRFAQDHPQRFAVLSLCEAQQPDAGSDQSVWQDMMLVGQRLHAHTEAALRAGVNDGSIRPDLTNIDILSKTLWAFVHGALQLTQTKRAVIEYEGHTMDAFLQVSMDFAMQALVRRS